MTKLAEIRARHERSRPIEEWMCDCIGRQPKDPHTCYCPYQLRTDRATLLQTIDTYQKAIKDRHDAGCCDCEYTDRTGCDRTWYCFDPLCALLPPENPND